MSKRQTSEHARPEERAFKPSPGSLGRRLLARDLAACRDCPGKRALATGTRHRARAPRRDGAPTRVLGARGVLPRAHCGRLRARSGMRHGWGIRRRALARRRRAPRAPHGARKERARGVHHRARAYLAARCQPRRARRVARGAAHRIRERAPGAARDRRQAGRGGQALPCPACSPPALSRDANALPLSEHRTCARAQYRMESRSCGRGHRHTCRIARRSDLRREGLL